MRRETLLERGLWRDEVCCGGIRSPSVLPSRSLNLLLTLTVIGSSSLYAFLGQWFLPSPTETSAFTRQRSLVRTQHRPPVKAAFCRQNASARRGSGHTLGLFYTSPITAVPTSAGAAPAPCPPAG